MPAGSVSVVIPTHDRPDLLRTTLRSVLAQRDVTIEVLVVDDGSGPATAAAVEAVAGGDDRVTLLRHPSGRGVSQARNTGIDAASGEWLAFVDDDDLFAPDKLAAQLAALAAVPECRWSCVGVVTIDEAGRITGWHHPPAERDVAVAMLVDDVAPGGGSGVVAHRELVEAAGRFDTDLSCNADWDFHLRLAQHSPVASVDRPLLAYRVHARAMSLDVDGCDQDFERMNEKYADLRARHGVTVDGAKWALWKSATYLRAGDRRRSRATRAEVGAGLGWARRGRAAVVTALPGGVRLSDYRQGRRVPAVWRAEASAWLAGLR